MDKDRQLEACIAAIDRAFSAVGRPEHFTNHTHCYECQESDDYFHQHSIESLASVSEPFETLPIAFLTDDAFVYFMPALARAMIRSGDDYSADTILPFLELRLHIFDNTQCAALRDLLYAFYERLHDRIHETAFDYSTIARILETLETEAQPET